LTLCANKAGKKSSTTAKHTHIFLKLILCLLRVLCLVCLPSFSYLMKLFLCSKAKKVSEMPVLGKKITQGSKGHERKNIIAI